MYWFIFSAPESVKKIFSVAYLGSKEFNALVKKEMMDRVRRHQYDENTAETRSKTICINIASLIGSSQLCVIYYRAQEFVQKQQKQVHILLLLLVPVEW